MSQVKVKEAFQSPEMLQNCLGFLRQYASEKSALAACAIVPLQDVKYPQVGLLPIACHLDGHCCPILSVHVTCNVARGTSHRVTNRAPWLCAGVEAAGLAPGGCERSTGATGHTQRAQAVVPAC